MSKLIDCRIVLADLSFDGLDLLVVLLTCGLQLADA
jgi:hypothetical protein